MLENPAHRELQKRLSSHMRLLLVDECQDTDPVQVDLIKALCGEQVNDGKLYFVGDFKQSIYRFRGADPRVFRKMKEATPVRGQLPLTRNFRSQPGILRFVNLLFRDVPLAGDGAKLEFDPLEPKRGNVCPGPHVEFLWADASDLPKGAAGTIDEARKREADCIARRICSMLDGNERIVADAQDDGTSAARPARQATLRSCFVLFQTYSTTKRRSSGKRYRIIWSEGMRFMRSRKSTMW